MTFDLQLFLALNEEYRERPLVPAPRRVDHAPDLLSQARRRVAVLEKRFDLAGRRVLEVGCGRGETALVLARELGCEVVAVDIQEYPEWDQRKGDGLSFRTVDIALDDPGVLGTFERAYSFAVWEHMRHPLASLESLFTLLEPGGLAYIYANLFRGPRASHRYREVFFPWPHLLFTDEVFREFYRYRNLPPRGPAWINRLTAAEYRLHFQEVGFLTRDLRYSVTPLDRPFYERFEDVLGRYPFTDLERDFIHAVLQRPGVTD